MGFEPRPPEDSYGRCGSDKIRQTVEDALSACTVVKEPHTSAKEVEVGIRVLRIRRLWELFDRTESSTSYPNSFRMAVLMFYLLLAIHWNACVYFMMSAYNGFGSDRWVYFDVNETLYPRNATLLKMYTYRFKHSFLLYR